MPTISEPELPPEELFIPQGKELVPRDFHIDESTVAVNALERASDLQQTLSLLGRMSQRTGLAWAMESRFADDIVDRYGSKTDKVLAGAEDNRLVMRRQAYGYFARAYGRDALIAAGRPQEEVNKETWNAFQDFIHAYADPRNLEQRNRYRDTLKQSANVLREQPATPTVPSASQPLEMTKQRQAAVVPQEATDTLLSTQDKLRAVSGDNRARFIPTTHREKNQAVALLDYLGPGPHFEGVDEQLNEIFIRQQKNANLAGLDPREGWADGLIAVRSVVHEYGDYYANARHEAEQLKQLKYLIDECDNPNVRLSDLLEELGEGAPDSNSLVRYMDLLALKSEGEVPADFDPLLTREDRTNPTDIQNKVVEDLYTQEKMSDEMQAYINHQVRSLRVGSLRKVIANALADQEARATFWDKMLHAIQGDFKLYATEVIDRR